MNALNNKDKSPKYENEQRYLNTLLKVRTQLASKQASKQTSKLASSGEAKAV